ncbi:MAG: hypothetical protein ACKOAD_06420 [Gammaproteobacteria bacterium]
MDKKQMNNLRQFGEKSIFSIEYSLLQNPYYEHEFGLLRDSWGELKIFLSGEELLRFSRDGVEQDYTWNLIYVVEWFCENLKHILTIDNFFSPTENQSVVDKVIFFYEHFDLDNDEMNGKAFDWTQKRDLYSASNGSFFPTIYMYSISDDKIEISWIDPGLIDYDIYFLSKNGSKKIEKSYFERVVREFVTEFLNNFKDSYPDEVNEKFQMLNSL